MCCRCFILFSSCKLPGKKENRQKNLKGIVYLFDSLRILFSYNLSAIKCGFFFFHFKHISCLFLLPLWKASYMFNKANYLVWYIHKGIILASNTHCRFPRPNSSVVLWHSHCVGRYFQQAVCSRVTVCWIWYWKIEMTWKLGINLRKGIYLWPEKSSRNAKLQKTIAQNRNSYKNSQRLALPQGRCPPWPLFALPCKIKTF